MHGLPSFLPFAGCPLRVLSAYGSCKYRSCDPASCSCHCEAPTGPWRPEREARGSALGVQFRSTWPDNRKVSGEYGTVTRRGVEDAATYKVCGRRWLARAASAFPRLPRRFAPRNDTSGVGAAAHQCPSAVELPCTRRSLSAAAFFLARRTCTDRRSLRKNIQNLAIRARTVHSYATRICHSSQLVKHYFF